MPFSLGLWGGRPAVEKNLQPHQQYMTYAKAAIKVSVRPILLVVVVVLLVAIVTIVPILVPRGHHHGHSSCQGSVTVLSRFHIVAI